MKHSIFIFLAVVLGITACKDMEKAPVKEGYSSVAVVVNSYPFDLPTSNINYASIENYQGRLRFESHQDIISTMQELEQEYIGWNNSFNEFYGNVSIEALDSIDDELALEDELPAINFESNLDFSSLRAYINGQVSMWLDNDILDEENDPDDHFIVDDEYRTILNINAEVIVKDTVYKLYNDKYITIHNETLDHSIEICDDINTGALNLDVMNDDERETLGITIILWKKGSGSSGSSTGTCDPKTLKNEKDFEFNNPKDKRIKWKLAIHNYPWGNNAVAKIKGYKKRKRRGWKKYRSQLTVQCYGKMTEKDNKKNPCKKYDFDNTESEKSKKCKAVGVYSGIATAEKNDVKGHFNGAGGIQTSQTLDW